MKMKQGTIEALRKMDFTWRSRAIKLLPEVQKRQETEKYIQDCHKEDKPELAFEAITTLPLEAQQTHFIKFLRRWPAKTGDLYRGSRDDAIRVVRNLLEPLKTREFDKVLSVLVHDIRYLDAQQHTLLDLIRSLSDKTLTQKHLIAAFGEQLRRGLYEQAIRTASHLNDDGFDYQCKQKVVDTLIAKGDYDAANHLTTSFRAQLTSKEGERCLRVQVRCGDLMKAINIVKRLGRNLTTKELETIFLAQTKKKMQKSAEETLDILLHHLENPHL